MDHSDVLERSQAESSAETLPPPYLPDPSTVSEPWRAAQLGRFTILQQLGVGGMGCVLAAYDPHLDRKVALKILHRQPGADRRQRDWTLREARALARVAHPHVVAVHEVGEAEEQVYLALEFVDGVTLRRWQSSTARSWRDVLRMYLLAGEGLLAAHQAGVIHRDFKPDNVLVGRNGLPKVADFGIACLHTTLETDAQEEEPSGAAVAAPLAPSTLVVQGPAWTDGGTDESSQNTQGSRRAGTLGYMSPEQRSGGVVSAASDQWSFCAALYEALCGHLPDVVPAYRAGTESATRLTELEADAAAAQSGVPPGLFAILARGLASEASRRYDGMGQLLAALRAEYDQGPGAARHATRAMVFVMSIVTLLLWLIIQYIASKKARIIQYGVGISSSMLLSTLLLGYRYRFSLRINPFHRWMWSLMLINFVQLLCLRLVGTFLIVMPFRVVHILEMTIWGGTLAIMAAQLVRPLGWALVFPISSIIVCALMESPPRRLLLLTYPIMCGLVLWVWRMASQNKIAVVFESLQERSEDLRERS